ncbi:MAG: hypothetical protein AAGJ08_18250 [Cyanobacteria bacterium P01_H01_bin.35]
MTNFWVDENCKWLVKNYLEVALAHLKELFFYLENLESLAGEKLEIYMRNFPR